MRSMTRRGPSDRLSPDEQVKFQDELQSWIMGEIRDGHALWEFGDYSHERNPITAKMSPVLADLFKNKSLWELLLRYFHHAKLTDSCFKQAILFVMAHVRSVNTTNLPDDLFIVQLVGRVHVQLSHLRDIAQYPDKCSYRLSKLNHEQLTLLKGLTSMVTVSDLALPAAPALHPLPAPPLLAPPPRPAIPTWMSKTPLSAIC